MDEPNGTVTHTIPLGKCPAVSLGQERQLTLLVYHQRGAEAVPLHSGQSFVIGRDPAADVSVAHPSLSSEHACIEIDGGEIWVEDLGSTNGTRVNGERVTRARIKAGDNLLLGAVAVSLHALSPLEGQVQGLCDHDHFVSIMEQEIIRHRMFSRQLGLIMVRSVDRSAPLSDWCQQVQRSLRPIDRMGQYSPTAVEIALPELPWGSLLQLGQTIATARSKGAPPLLCGVAMFPDTAASAAELLEAARTAAQRASAKQSVNAAPIKASHTLDGHASAIVRSPAMQKLYATIERMGRSPIPVLILGETGSGKELVARALHQSSGRKALPCVNCAAIPGQLVESIMFGHEKGAFTGADRQTRGVFEQAGDGSVLLDEIGELSPAAQAALLRVLDTKRITRVGSTKEIPVNVRILAATHRNLDAMCEAGTFRRDLLYRINTMTLRVPPLRERQEEIEPLAELFLEQANQANDCHVLGFTSEVLDVWQQYRWPGNVRELRNVVHRAAVLAESDMITVEELPERIRSPRGAHAVALPAPSGAPTEGPGAEPSDLDFKTRIRLYEIELIRSALEQAGWNKTLAAQRLRIPLRTLIYKVKSFDVQPPVEPSPSSG